MISIKDKLENVGNGLAGAFVPSYLGFQFLKLRRLEDYAEPVSKKIEKDFLFVQEGLSFGYDIISYTIGALSGARIALNNYNLDSASRETSLMTLGTIIAIRAASGIILSNSTNKAKEKYASLPQ